MVTTRHLDAARTRGRPRPLSRFPTPWDSVHAVLAGRDTFDKRRRNGKQRAAGDFAGPSLLATRNHSKPLSRPRRSHRRRGTGTTVQNEDDNENRSYLGYSSNQTLTTLGLSLQSRRVVICRSFTRIGRRSPRRRDTSRGINEEPKENSTKCAVVLGNAWILPAAFINDLGEDGALISSKNWVASRILEQCVSDKTKKVLWRLSVSWNGQTLKTVTCNCSFD